MAIEKIDIETFLDYSKHYPVIDVRSPSEYDHAHIPGAVSLPLFTNEERKIVGTIYKQNSRANAIKAGLEFFGPKMKQVVEEAERIAGGLKFIDKKNNTLLIHCWRGGMRSGAIAWLLDLYGFKIYTLQGGYKQFRRFALEMLEKPQVFSIIGGYTGSGKSYVLKELSKQGKTIIDLEEMANHRGSAFGAIGLGAQPSQEMFENMLALKLYQINDEGEYENNSYRHDNSIWLEDESQRIGLVNIPQPFWNMMRSAPVYFLNVPFEKRRQHLVKEYGKLDTEKMINAILRIRKRLGGLETKTAVNYLIEGNTEASFDVLLKYYDKVYMRALHSRENIDQMMINIECEDVKTSINARKLLNELNKSKTY